MVSRVFSRLLHVLTFYKPNGIASLQPVFSIYKPNGLLVGTLFAGIGNKYIVDSIMPESIHFSLADKVHALTFLFIMFSIGVTILVYQFYVKEKNTIARKIDYISFVVFTSFYIIMNIIWLNEAIYG